MAARAKRGGSSKSGRGKLSTKALSSFDGANYSEKRGWIYFPTLDTRREIDTYTHWELVKKARWFYANSGFARRVVNGCAGMVGYMTPRSLTGDKEWSRDAENNFENRAGSAQICDLMGKHNFYSIQPKLTGNDLKDGDLLLALTKTANGGAAFMPYEAHQIGNSSSTDSSLFENGVRTNQFGKHLLYRILNGTGHFDISATDAIYFANFERLNQTRGLTGFAHAINHLHDRTEIFSDAKLGWKNSNHNGFYKTRSGAKPAAANRMGTGRNRTQIAPDPSKPEEKIDIEKVMQGGKLQDLFDGEEIKILHDARPHPHQMALDDWLVRDMAWGFGLSPEVLWYVGKINGTTNRFLLADAVKWVEQRQQMLVDLFCTRYWVYHIACEMKAGRLRRCKDPEWWKVGWIPQPKLTVDRGRDGKLSIDLHKGGMMTLKRHYAEQFSEDWKPNVDDWASELGYMRKKLLDEGFKDIAEAQALLGVNFGSSADPKAPDAPGKNDLTDEGEE